jgi:hypothetical protein
MSRPAEISTDFDARRFVLGGTLAMWAKRDDAKPQAGRRRTASAAVALIDAMLAELHKIRAQLISETRRSDDASAAR